MSQLAPAPKFTATFVDADGYTVPAVGWKLYTYAAGTSTPKVTYTNYGLGTANANPVVLDARGEADVWLSGNYKFILKTDVDATVWTVDNVNDIETAATFTTATLAGALTVTSTAVTWSGNPTHSGNHTFSGNVVINGNTTLGDSAADTVTFNATVTAPLFSGSPTGTIVAGTYTPTLVNGTNCAASTAYQCTYIRIGSVVHVSGAVDIDPTAAAAANTILSLSLPIASNIGNWFELSGVGSDAIAAAASGNSVASIYGDTGANKATFSFNAGSTSNVSWVFNFQYLIV